MKTVQDRVYLVIPLRASICRDNMCQCTQHESCHAEVSLLRTAYCALIHRLIQMKVKWKDSLCLWERGEHSDTIIPPSKKKWGYHCGLNIGKNWSQLLRICGINIRIIRFCWQRFQTLNKFGTWAIGCREIPKIALECATWAMYLNGLITICWIKTCFLRKVKRCTCQLNICSTEWVHCLGSPQHSV